jgi:hypothetical protein
MDTNRIVKKGKGYNMIYGKGNIVNGQFVITEQKEIDQSTLTSDCWMIQFKGISACTECEFKNTKDCGGGETLRKLNI